VTTTTQLQENIMAPTTAQALPDALAPPAWDSTLAAEVRSLADRLLPMFYADLKRVAHHERARVAAGMTLQTTALVHEAYLKLRGSVGWNDDAHFVRAAAVAMRHALVDHAREQLTAKRGEGAEHLPLTGSLEQTEASDAMLVALNDALAQLATQSLRLAQVVECRYFAGYDEVATAKALGISERTVRRDWTLARAWLVRELRAS
jgi:RNA polymerase sigma factor (TIGR02999 family)